MEEVYDPLFKIRPLLDHMNAVFSEYYETSRYVSIDEMMIGTRCWVAFLQYMPKKTTSGHPISISLCCLSASIKCGLTAGLCETSWTYVLVEKRNGMQKGARL